MLITCKNITVVHLLCFWHDKYCIKALTFQTECILAFSLVSTSKLPIMNSSTYNSNNNNSKENKRWTPFHRQTKPVENIFCPYIWCSWSWKRKLIIMDKGQRSIKLECPFQLVELQQEETHSFCNLYKNSMVQFMPEINTLCFSFSFFLFFYFCDVWNMYRLLF